MLVQYIRLKVIELQPHARRLVSSVTLPSPDGTKRHSLFDPDE